MAVPWPDHDLAASGGDIFRARVVPRMGSDAADYVRAGAVCRGWADAMLRDAPQQRRAYRRSWALPCVDGCTGLPRWSPCGAYFAYVAWAEGGRAWRRLFVYRAFDGAKVREIDLFANMRPDAVDVVRFNNVDMDNITVAFLEGSARVIVVERNYFSVFDVASGARVLHRYVAIDAGSLGYGALALGHGRGAFAIGSSNFGCADFDSADVGFVEVWDVRAGTVRRLELPVPAVFDPDDEFHLAVDDARFSPDGARLAVSFLGIVSAFDVSDGRAVGAFDANADGSFPRSMSSRSRTGAWVPCVQWLDDRSLLLPRLFDAEGLHADVVWDVHDGARPCAPVRVPDGRPPPNNCDLIGTAIPSPDGLAELTRDVSEIRIGLR